MCKVQLKKVEKQAKWKSFNKTAQTMTLKMLAVKFIFWKFIWTSEWKAEWKSDLIKRKKKKYRRKDIEALKLRSINFYDFWDLTRVRL